MKMVAAKGAEIPSLGFGTYGMSREAMLRTVPAALSAGFRHIDALRGRLTAMAVHLLLLQEGVISTNGHPQGFGRSTLSAWRLDASPSDTPGSGTTIGQVHSAQDLLQLQWNSPDRGLASVTLKQRVNL